MAGKIERFNSVTGAFTMTNSASTTPKIPFGPAAGALLVVDSLTGGAATINWYAVLASSDTPVPLYDSNGAVTTAIAASRAYALPDALFGAPFVVGVADTGTITVRLSVKG